MCLCILKAIFCIINIILTILGLGIIGAGVAILIEVNQNIGIIIIIIGSIFTAIFFCGCCGAISKNACLLITYSVIILIFAILTIVSTILFSNNIAYIKDLVVSETAGNLNTVQIWEPVLHCCGTTGPDSYDYGAIPITCCPENINNLDLSQIGSNWDVLPQFTCEMSQAYPRGCLDVVGETVEYILNTIKTLMICIGIAEVIMFGIAIVLVCEENKRGVKQRTRAVARVEFEVGQH